MDLHQLEEMDYRNGPALWDAGEGVCCAAYQLGACSHTEAEPDVRQCERCDADIYPMSDGSWSSGYGSHLATTCDGIHLHRPFTSVPDGHHCPADDDCPF